MEDMLKFYYNIEVEKIEEKNGIYHFLYENNHFYLHPLERTIDELNDIYEVCSELKMRNLQVHTFIRNKENKINTKIYEIEYVLLKVEGNPIEEFNILDIVKIMEQFVLSSNKNTLYRNNWGDLWSKKIDYFEYQIKELGKDKKVVLNSFSYYIGLAENAISYVNNTTFHFPKPSLERVTLSHKRIFFPNYRRDYLNPLNFIFDLEVRDIAEYIKSIFFQNEQDAWIELKTFLSMSKLSIYGYQMFYARLLYPSYYFDIYERIMNKKENEEKLIPIIEKANAYEKFLKRVYLEITKYTVIDKIDWIINKKEL